MLDGLDLAAGLGLAALMLILLAAPASGTVLSRLPRLGPPTLLGLAGLFAGPLGFAAGAC